MYSEVNHLYICTYPLFFRFLYSFPTQVITEYFEEFPVPYGSFWLVTYFIYSNVYVSIPVYPHPPAFPQKPSVYFLHLLLYFYFVSLFVAFFIFFIGG